MVFIQTGSSKWGISLIEVGDMVFLYSVCTPGAYSFICILGAVLILNKLKRNAY